MNIVNLQRDQMWIDPALASSTWPTLSSRANSDGVVYTDVGRCFINSTTDGTATGTVAGVMIQQPRGENTPYRVIGSCNVSTKIAVGYMSGTSGTNDAWSDKTLIPILAYTQFDFVLNVKATDGTEPLIFGIFSPGVSTFISANLSVQRLNVTPPQFSAAVS